MAPKVRETANSRKAREGPQLPLPPTQRPRNSADPIMQRYPLRKEVPPKSFPARHTLSARVTDDTHCTGMNVKVRKMRNKDQVPREKP